VNPFLKERSWNVVENKGPLWKTWERNWNVYENTGLVAGKSARAGKCELLAVASFPPPNLKSERQSEG
jgi:hypothetical protein